MFTVKRSPVDVVLPSGTAVLKADDPLVADMAALSAGSVIFFACDGRNPVLSAHRDAGKRAVFVGDGSIVLAEGAAETTLMKLDEVPLTLGGRVGFQVENVLAAVAAAWSLGVPHEITIATLRAIHADTNDCPGRFNLLKVGGVDVVIDDSHNSSALVALIAALDNFPHERRTIVYSAGDGRTNAEIIRQGEQLGAAFDRVVLYDDYSACDRAAGELPALFRQGLAADGLTTGKRATGKRAVEVLDVAEHRQAIETALALMGPGELLVVQTEDEDIEQTLNIIGNLAGRTTGGPKRPNRAAVL
jgi:cyanophycin synthetase